MSSSSSAAGQSWFLTSEEVLLTTEVVALLPLIVFHAIRLWKLRQDLRRTHWLPYFHILSLLALLSLLPTVLWFVVCLYGNFEMKLCSADSDVNVVIFQDVIFGIMNFGNFCINALFAVLGYFARKELVVYRNGPGTWRQQSGRFKILALVLIALGGLYFVNYNDSTFSPEWNVMIIGSTASCILTLVTASISTAQVGILARTIRYPQRVFPFVSTKFLFAVTLLFPLGAVLGASEYFHPFSLDGAVAWLDAVCFVTYNYLLAWAFRRPETQFQTPLLGPI